jgi:hypothetical protein
MSVLFVHSISVRARWKVSSFTVAASQSLILWVNCLLCRTIIITMKLILSVSDTITHRLVVPTALRDITKSNLCNYGLRDIRFNTDAT